jgi:hypothetical protein
LARNEEFAPCSTGSGAYFLDALKLRSSGILGHFRRSVRLLIANERIFPAHAETTLAGLQRWFSKSPRRKKKQSRSFGGQRSA